MAVPPPEALPAVEMTVPPPEALPAEDDGPTAVTVPPPLETRGRCRPDMMVQPPETAAVVVMPRRRSAT
jgi:hypothetical protein